MTKQPWRENVDLTITVVRNNRFNSVKEVLEELRDYEGVAPKYQENTFKSVEEGFNTHEDVFYALGRRLGEDKFIIVENNGYFAGTPESAQNLSRPKNRLEQKVDADAPYMVGFYWNVNMDNALNIAVAGECLWSEEAFKGFEPEHVATHWIFGKDKLKTLQELFGEDSDTVTDGLKSVTLLTGVEFPDDWLEGQWEVAEWDLKAKKEAESGPRKQLKSAAPTDDPGVSEVPN